MDDRMRMLFSSILLFAGMTFCVFAVTHLPCYAQEGLSDEQLYGDDEENVLGHSSVNKSLSSDNRKEQNDSQQRTGTKNNYTNSEQALQNSITKEDDGKHKLKNTTKKKKKKSALDAQNTSSLEESEEEKKQARQITAIETDENNQLDEKQTEAQSSTQQVVFDKSKAMETNCPVIDEMLCKKICQKEFDIESLLKRVITDESEVTTECYINGQKVTSGRICNPGEYDIRIVATDEFGNTTDQTISVIVNTQTRYQGKTVLGCSIAGIMIIGGGCFWRERKKSKWEEKDEKKNDRTGKVTMPQKALKKLFH